MTRAVLLDFGGTLDADGTPWGDRFHAGYREAGGWLSAEAFAELFRRADARLAGAPGVARFGLARMVEEQVRILRGLLPDGAAIAPGPWAEGFLAAAMETARRNRPLLEAMGRHRRLAIVSNFTGNLRPCLMELGLADLFAAIVDSAEAGVRKPDPGLFRIAFGALGRRAEECWMVGDNPAADIAPASALGCRTCWLAPPARPVPEGLAPDRRIASLTELPAVLD